MIWIPTHYKGIEFPSKTHAKYARVFDALEMKWEWSNDVFHLNDAGQYFIVVRDFVKNSRINSAKELAVKGNQVVVANDNSEMMFYNGKVEHTWYEAKNPTLSNAFLFYCEICDGYRFLCWDDNYACPICGNHDGDHHLLRTTDNLFRDVMWE